MFYFLLQVFTALAGVDPDALRTFGEVCEAHGYQFEAHNVTTEDGYILTLFRIPGLIGEEATSGKPVAFLQHGLLDLADTWIMNEPSPGFMFADSGFDVWFGNSRGSYHSLNHVKYTTKDPQYWQFTWQHMADYDIPAVIPFVLKYTNLQKLTYVGHSQGTLQMFAHLSTVPSFINNINIFIALAPIGTVRYIDVTLFNILKLIPLFSALEAAGVYDFLPNLQTNLLFYETCYYFGIICDDVIGYFADMQVDADNLERFPTILSHEPGGTSTLNMEHWQQMTNYLTNKVQKYDYGATGNLANYGTKDAPQYDFTKIPGPIALFTGKEDRLGDVTDEEWLEKTIPSASVVYKVEEPTFGHLTFLWGKDMSYFNTVIALANQYKTSRQSQELA
jgi:pimeloyl-ACP methyl ester carboxylesterase